jgi:hypothetical protein
VLTSTIPLLGELVGELSVRSERFRRLWARHDVEAVGPAGRTFNHPLVGPIELWIERLAIIGRHHHSPQAIRKHHFPGAKS